MFGARVHITSQQKRRGIATKETGGAGQGQAVRLRIGNPRDDVDQGFLPLFGPLVCEIKHPIQFESLVSKWW